MKRRLIATLLMLCMVLIFLPTSASADTAYMTSGDLNMARLTKEQIQAKWKEITTATSLYEEVPSVSAPYSAGKLSDSFLQSGITYLNYVRYVAHLPQVRLSDTLNEDAQHGAVLLAALDNGLSHYPSQPADMDDEFYRRGYAATSSSNLSGRWGYVDTSCLQSAVQGCMDDYSSQSNLASVGHRRWLLNPTLLNVGFGYAKSATGWSFIDTKIFDRSGAAVNYDFIAWPASGNFPTNLFSISTPWSITLNPSKYQQPSRGSVKITITRESDGKKWTFDSTTGTPTNVYTAYMTVENSGYGINNCIIFHPGSANIDAYNGVFTVEVSGIYDRNGTAATLCYQVDFFNVQTFGVHTHSYSKGETVAPTCTAQGYTTYTCTCGESYEDDYVDATGHSYKGVTTAPTCTEQGYTTYTCACGDSYADDHVDALGHTEKTITGKAATCTATGLTDGKKCTACDTVTVKQETIAAKAHSYQSKVTAPTCGARGYTTYTCSACGSSYQSDYKNATGKHSYSNEFDASCNVCGDIREVKIKTTPMYRLYNPNSGEHFYTGSVVERVDLVEAGWNYEGIAWNAPVNGGDPVYRLYNPNSGDHHYTMSTVERDDLVAVGWNYEGVAWNSASIENVPQYRLYNPNADCGSHHYTSSTEERDMLVSVGWILEGIGWYGLLN